MEDGQFLDNCQPDNWTDLVLQYQLNRCQCDVRINKLPMVVVGESIMCILPSRLLGPQSPRTGPRAHATTRLRYRVGRLELPHPFFSNMHTQQLEEHFYCPRSPPNPILNLNSYKKMPDFVAYVNGAAGKQLPLLSVGLGVAQLSGGWWPPGSHKDKEWVATGYSFDG